MIFTSFLGSLLGFIIIGMLSATQRKTTPHDYLVASGEVKPWMAGLSACSSLVSGGSLIGITGFVYMTGIAGAMIYSGYILFPFILWYCTPIIQAKSKEKKLHTFSALLARWQEREMKWVRLLSAVMIIFMLSIYAAAQLKGGSKALNVILGWDINAGAFVGAIIVLAYCFAGGIRASIWTDSAQTIVMVLGLGLLVSTVLSHVGGFGTLIDTLNADDPSLLNPLAGEYNYGFGLFFMGWIFALIFGLLGLPHVMIRFMTVNDPKDAQRTVPWMISFVIIISALVVMVALLARAVVPPADFDAELIMPILAQSYMSEAVVGLMLATIFAATISTSDSLILSCSAAITRDLVVSDLRESYRWAKIGTIISTVIALLITLYAPGNVFNLVMFVVSALGSSFTPLLLVQIFGAKPSQSTALTMMLSGLFAALIWRLYGDYQAIPEALPGVTVSFFSYGCAWLVKKIKTSES